MKTPSTWKFWQQPVVMPLAATVRRRLAQDRGVSDQIAASLRMVTRRGHYADRTVTFFRVIDPAAVDKAGINLRDFRDLDAYDRLHLHDGHIERDGRIVLNRQQSTTGGDGS